MAGSTGDGLLDLSFALHANRGVYALLLGSGVSRAAGIPTGWEIVLDLVDKVAAAAGEDPGSDHAAWYEAAFNEPAEYTRVVKRLSRTKAERRGLLRPYFEPTDEEREQGLKVPTIAHRAIARLTKAGYVRLILTTNFDRLIETALADEGVAPDVITSDDDLKGAFPLVHSSCMIVKLHGDYLDTRIKNTSRELAKYSNRTNEFLDRVFGEFGLVVCGWSAEWDTALADAIMRCPTRRFTTYWLTRGELKDEAVRLASQRRAEIVAIQSADDVFPRIEEHIRSIEEVGRKHPLSRDLAVATVKRYLSEPRFRIPLHDLVHGEAENVEAQVRGQEFPLYGPTATQEFAPFFQQRLRKLEALVDQLLGMTAAIAYYDEGDNAYLLTRSIERLSDFGLDSGQFALLGIRRYPALLLMYAGGIAAIVSRRFRNLAAILQSPMTRKEGSREKTNAIRMLHVWDVFSHEAYKLVPRPNAAREYTPANEYVADILAPVLKDYATGAQFEEAFDLFEFLLGLVHVDLSGQAQLTWAPFGRFAWKYWGLLGEGEDSPLLDFVNTAKTQGADGPLVRAGFFGGSVERLKEVVDAYNAWLVQNRRSWW